MRKLLHDEILQTRLTVADALAASRHPVIGILEDIRSLYNVGSCFRTADAMLLERLILTGYTETPPRKEIVKTALGATESVPWEYHKHTTDSIAELKERGITVLALEITDTSTPLNTPLDFSYPIALVAGNEISGVKSETLAQCSGSLSIPMYGVKHSLNVAVAFGIGVWELVRRYRDLEARSESNEQTRKEGE